ncbi:hypothetical protein L9F63_013888, partial [Diploptera punctata]
MKSLLFFIIWNLTGVLCEGNSMRTHPYSRRGHFKHLFGKVSPKHEEVFRPKTFKHHYHFYHPEHHMKKYRHKKQLEPISPQMHTGEPKTRRENKPEEKIQESFNKFGTNYESGHVGIPYYITASVLNEMNEKDPRLTSLTKEMFKNKKFKKYDVPDYRRKLNKDKSTKQKFDSTQENRKVKSNLAPSDHHRDKNK